MGERAAEQARCGAISLCKEHVAWVWLRWEVSEPACPGHGGPCGAASPGRGAQHRAPGAAGETCHRHVCLHVCVPRSDTTLHKLMTSILCLILSVLLPAGTFLTLPAPCGMGTPCAVQPVTFRLQSPHCWRRTHPRMHGHQGRAAVGLCVFGGGGLLSQNCPCRPVAGPGVLANAPVAA